MDYIAKDTALTATADAIRSKAGTTDPITWDETAGFSSAVSAIPEGEDLSPELAKQDGLIDQIQAALQGKAAGGEVGGLTQYVKFTATPASSTSFVINNPLGGVAKKVSVTRTTTATTSSRKIQQYLADLDLRMGALYAVDSGGSARYVVTAVDSGVNNGNFMIKDGTITLYRFNSANTWDTSNEYEVEIWQ